ncbi:hypothetical protein [Mucilaginibacter pedocola]|uniref:Uncharacterized protein n=1 Tax=Mucilaginibacter pedocola TaxID=1792845 RepID=A0A1S9P858_9SPHI|nr:hypothetical protein [Mucilaginibacter pedocola]OOQ57124.1 hypothetical protein BC343_16520 [Mucilaginibacter pedocola]
MNLADIKQKKTTGDLQITGNMVGITADNARQALRRVDSKHHAAVCSALTKIITAREQLLNEKHS